MKNLSVKAWVIIIIVGAVVVFGGGAGAIKFSSSSPFCSSCHQYEKASWEVSGHPNVGCINCHTKGFVKDKAVGMVKVLYTVTGKVDPHHDKLPNNVAVTAKNCAACHMDSRKADAQFISRHNEYMQQTNSCTTCHGNVGHRYSIQSQKLEVKK